MKDFEEFASGTEEELVLDTKESTMTYAILKSDLETVNNLLAGGHELTIDEFAQCKDTQIFKMLWNKIIWTADSFHQLAKHEKCQNMIILVFYKLKKSDQLDHKVTLACLKEAISTNNFIYVNSFNMHIFGNYFPSQKILSSLYKDYLETCSAESNWLDASFIPKLRICMTLYASGARLNNPFAPKEVKALHNFTGLITKYIDTYRAVISNVIEKNALFLSVEWLFLQFLHAHINDYFKPNAELKWMATKLNELVTIQYQLCLWKNKDNIYMQITDEYDFLMGFLNDKKAKTILFNDMPLSNYLAGLLVLFLCRIDPSKVNFNKSFFHLNWKVFLETYFNEKNNEVRASLVAKLNSAIDCDNAEKKPVKQQEFNALLSFITQTDSDQAQQSGVDITSINGPDFFNNLVEYLVADGDIPSLASVRQSCKTWRDAIDKAFIWATLLEEIGGSLWEIEYKKPAADVISELFTPSSIFVMQCYDYITNKNIYLMSAAPDAWAIARLWGILTNNTQLALKHRGQYYYRGTINATSTSIACAYGRDRVVEELVKLPKNPSFLDTCYDGSIQASDVGWITNVQGWPLKKLMHFSSNPLLDALSFCQPETTKILLQHRANLYKTFKGYPLFLFALLRHCDHKSGQEIIKVIDDEIKNNKAKYPDLLQREKLTTGKKFILFVIDLPSNESFKKLIEAMQSTYPNKKQNYPMMHPLWMVLSDNADILCEQLPLARLSWVFSYNWRSPFHSLHFKIIETFVNCLSETQDEMESQFCRENIVNFTNHLRSKKDLLKNPHRNKKFGKRYQFFIELADGFDKNTLVHADEEKETPHLIDEEEPTRDDNNNDNNDDPHRPKGGEQWKKT